MSIKTKEVTTPAGMVRVYGGKHQSTYFAHIELLGNGPSRVSTCMRIEHSAESTLALRQLAEHCISVAQYIEDICAQDAYVRAIAADAQEDE